VEARLEAAVVPLLEEFVEEIGEAAQEEPVEAVPVLEGVAGMALYPMELVQELHAMEERKQYQKLHCEEPDTWRRSSSSIQV
jgi:hypothetical protein